MVLAENMVKYLEDIKPLLLRVTLLARNGGINGGRTFTFDLDLLNGLHFHTNKLNFLGFNIKSHISLPFAELVGIITSIIKNK